jgi:predicted house-cleaning noncanonical NTP pyrophosphatase (MazG superfamily)
MTRKEYNKLIRDQIPEILAAQNVAFSVEEMTEIDYRQALRTKLIEEAEEAAEADDADFITELADLLEVIDATMAAYGISRNQVLDCQTNRRTERGGFMQKLRLLWTDNSH